VHDQNNDQQAKDTQTVSESTAMSFIPRQYSWDYSHEHESKKLFILQ